MAPELSYETQTIWKRIMAMLPEDIRFDENVKPVEEAFKWRNSTIHVDRFPNPNSRLKVLLHHGVGTNGRLLSMITGAPLARLGYEVVAVDMPLYGMTNNNEPTIRYEDWLDVSLKFIDQESKRDGKPIVLYGLSAGGMLCYHVASQESRVAGVVSMCFIDTENPAVLKEISIFPSFVEDLNQTLLPMLSHSPLKNIKVPMKSVSKMTGLVNIPEALSILMDDSTSAGALVTLGFIGSMYEYKSPVQPQEFTRCPFLLTQPAEDRWSPFSVSESFWNRLAAKKEKVILENASHYPMESPGIYQMRDAINAFLKSL